MWIVWLAGCPREPEPADPCDAPSSPTWQNFAQGYITTWCSPCHAAAIVGAGRNGAPEGVDFDRWSSVYGFRDAIAVRATGDSPEMPPLGGVDPDDVNRLEQWLACGALGADPIPDPCDSPVSGPATVVSSQDDADALCAASNRVAGLTAVGSASVGCLCGVDGDLVVTDGELDLPLATEVTGDLRITGGELVAPALEQVGGALLASGGITALSVPSLGSVGGDVRLTDLAALHQASFDGLVEVGGEWLVARSPTLETVDVPRLRSVGGDFVQEDLSALTEIAGTRALERIGGTLVLHRLPKLAVLDDWSFLLLVEVGGDLVIEDNVSLVAIHGFTTLPTAPGHLSIQRNDGLIRINGFDLLTRIAGDLRIADNPRQLSVTGFVNLEQVDGEVVFEDLPDLVSLLGLAEMRQAGALRFTRLGSTALGGFTRLEAVTTELVVEASPSLIQIGGFQALTIVGGDVRLVDNALLATIDGWWGIDVVGGSVEARDNPTLPTSTVEAWVQQIGEEDVGGTVTIEGNGPG